MSFDPDISGYFPNIVVGGSDYTVPFSDLQSVSSGNAGDVREFLYSVLEGVADEYLDPATSGSTQMSVTRSSTVPNDTTIRKSYTVAFNLDFPATTVKDEPA